ncbi:glycosyltransferase [Paenibacillus sp. CAU 1782]
MGVKEDCLITVVIPVYNVELYLDQCLGSVCSQSYQNIEVIVLNDGSTDSSGSICEWWAQKDERISYVQHSNIGLGLTRNRGIQLSKGKYITFIDSDDWIDNDFIKIMYEKMEREHVDICTCDYQEFDESKKELGNIKKSGAASNLLLPHMWGRLFNKNLFTEYDIKMPFGAYEDLATYPILDRLASSTVFVEKSLYYYRVNTGKSIMNNLEYVKQYPEVFHRLINEFKRLNIYESNKDQLATLAFLNMKYGLKRVKKVWEVEEYQQELSRFKHVLQEYFDDNARVYQQKIWVWGSYNLSRLAQYLMFDFDIAEKETTYYGFSSIISLMSEEHVFEMKHTNAFRTNMMRRDFEKTFKHLESSKNDYIVLDFLEERYDILKINHSFVTRSEALDQSSFSVRDFTVIRRDSNECKELWEESCLMMIDLLKRKFSLERIILVESYLCENYQDKNTEMTYSFNNVYQANIILSHYYSFFKDNLPGIKVVRIPEEINYSDKHFVHGCEPFYLNANAIKKLADNILLFIRELTKN